MKNISLLDPDDRKFLRSKSVDYLKERFPRYDNLNLSLIDNTLVIQITLQQDLPILIKACPKLLIRAQDAIGVARVGIKLKNAVVFQYSNFITCPMALEFNQQASIIKKGLEKMSQAIAAIPETPTPTQIEQEKTPRAEADGVDQSSFTDELFSLTEITTRTGIPEAGLEQYINLDGIKSYRLRDEILLPRAAIRPAIEGFYIWEASIKSNEALSLLVQQEIPISNGNDSNSNAFRQQEPSTGTKQAKQPKQGRTKYKLANDFKVSNSYNKTIAALVEAQGKKSSECLQAIASNSVDGEAIVKKIALKYKNPAKAEKGLMKAAAELVNSQSQVSQ